MAELEAANEAIKAAVAWGLNDFDLMTDSSTVFRWMTNAMRGYGPIMSHGMSELLVKRRISTIKKTIEEEQLQVKFKLIGSAENKADRLTRVPSDWLTVVKEPMSIIAVAIEGEQESTDILKKLHEIHHFGVKRMKFLARKLWGPERVTESQIQAVVKGCSRCTSIDPAPMKWERGELGVKKTWQRLATDVTHTTEGKFLMFIDCGPSLFTVWRKIKSENDEEICTVLKAVFNEFGPPKELLMDNFATNRGAAIRKLLTEMGVEILFRCANRPSGNGIVERCHRTIKRMAARSGNRIEDMVAWYNATPNSGGIIPASTVFAQQRRLPLPINFADRFPEIREIENNAELHVGDAVFVKPANSRCTTQWRRAVVDGFRRPHQVLIDGVPFHVSHVRLAPKEDSEPADNKSKMPGVSHRSSETPVYSDSSEDDDEWPKDNQEGDPEFSQTSRSRDKEQRPHRTIVRPKRFEDFVCSGLQRPEANGTLQCTDSVCVCALMTRGGVIRRR